MYQNELKLAQERDQLREQLAAERRDNDAQAEAYVRRINELREMAEVTVETGVTDERCPRCGSRICLDYYCENGHPKARPGMQVSNLTELEKAKNQRNSYD